MTANLNFDKLAKIIEAHDDFKPLHPIVQSSALFHFPARMHEFAEENRMEDDDLLFWNDHFFLPFRNVAVEDGGSCVLLWETEEQRGLGNWLFFMVAAPIDTNPALMNEYSDSHKLSDAEKALIQRASAQCPPGTMGITMGRARYEPFDPTMRNSNGSLTRHYEIVPIFHTVASPEAIMLHPGQFMAMSEAERTEMGHASGHHFTTAVEEIMVFNTPGRFVLERKNKRTDHTMAKNVKNGRITRSDLRPLYTFVRPHEACATMGIPMPETGKGKAPHARRRHFRTLTSERYKEAKGKTILIPASWVGPEEAVKGNKRYRVCLEL